MRIFKRLRHALINKARVGRTAPKPPVHDVPHLEEWAMRFVKDAADEGAIPTNGDIVLACADTKNSGYVMRIRNTEMSAGVFTSEASTIDISGDTAAALRRMPL